MANSAAGGKRLAFLLPNMRGGGAERVALRLMEDFVHAGHDVDLLLMAARGELMELLPSQVRVIDLKAGRIRDVIWPLRRYFRDEEPEAMQIFMWPLTSVGLTAHRLARSRARTVVSEHTVLSRHYSHLGQAAVQALRWSIRMTYPWADARITVSEVAADDMAHVAGLPRDMIEVIYNPVGTPVSAVAAAPEVEALWGAAGQRIISVGSLKGVKNHMLLICAFARLTHRRRATLMILGEGELRQPLMELAAREGVADRVRLPGFFANPWPFYASADLFALSSDYEGYPLVLIEAMRSGLKVVSTDCESGPREILDGGKYGMLVPCGDAEALATAMERALDEPADAQALRDRAEQLSGAETSDRYLDLMLGRA